MGLIEWFSVMRRTLSARNKSMKLKRSLRSSQKITRRLAEFGQGASSICVETKYGPFLVDPSDLKIARNLLHYDQFNEAEIDLLVSLSKIHDPRLLIVGGHIGTVALPVASSYSRVDVVEANPKTASLLQRNIALHDLKHVNLFEIAAAEVEGTIEFLMNTVNSGGSKRFPRVFNQSHFFDAKKVVVKSARLDDLLTDDYDVVFIDIEGAEYFALQGMTRLLDQSTYLCLEFMPHLIKQVASVSIGDWLSCIPKKYDAAYFLDTNQFADGRLELELAFEKKFENLENADQVVCFCRSTNPCCIGL